MENIMFTKVGQSVTIKPVNLIMKGLVAYESSSSNSDSEQVEIEDKPTAPAKYTHNDDVNINLNRAKTSDDYGINASTRGRMILSSPCASKEKEERKRETETEVDTNTHGKMQEHNRYENMSETSKSQKLLSKIIFYDHSEEIEGKVEELFDPVLQSKISKWHDLMKKGLIFNDRLEQTHEFRNPHITSKLIEFLELDEIGSNFNSNIFDPHSFQERGYYEKIAEEQIQVIRDKETHVQSVINSKIVNKCTNISSQSRVINFVPTSQQSNSK